MPIQHNAIVDPNIHEPKGVSTATSGQVYVANGSSSGVWTDLTTSYSMVDAGHFESTTSQEPTTLDTPLQVNFGPASSNSAVSVNAAGRLTILQSGLYSIIWGGSFSRSANAGQAIIAASLFKDGSRVGPVIAHRLDDGNFTVPYSLTTVGVYTAGTYFELWIARDSSGINDGGFLSKTINIPDWPNSASAFVSVNKIEGAVS